MGLLSYFKRQPDAEPAALAAPPPEPDAVAAARARARRRLLGATVLLGVGVIGFPLLFETQPRPIPVDIPIEIPSKDQDTPGMRAPATPMARASAAVVDDGPVQPLVVPGKSGAADRAAAAPVEIVERGTEQGREWASGAPGGAKGAANTSASTSASMSASNAAAKPPAAPSTASKPAAAAASPPAPAPARPADDGARARALLDGQPAPALAASAAAPQASAGTSRVVVQVGAYTDATKLAEARRKLESLGFKTYTQVVENEAGKRTRVRIGPFPTRAEADKAAARVKAAGLPAAILAL